ncbi:Glutathione peroxidase like protein [Heterostelium album PN500]|uniref:Glutathione peroxidase n=1 Tax=Heterostelium pallidum (strain ATCC 26659 / Pp 5 / PN500) TaxID=670386 RepID=D3BR00_HETP5|nr:Glutathione peroxidase like protein [Heterostelium album PN500]EFA76186.1 Glutathione peroxidase like protein [Heterostelium album PN500]|eukprot:XP_020428319.1 Glutathione peroxidase like protein [Heterostelium album PN500]
MYRIYSMSLVWIVLVCSLMIAGYNGGVGVYAQQTNITCTQPSTSFYSLSYQLINGTTINFDQFKGCNDLVEKFGTTEFVILGFPCAQFMNQSPGSGDEILLTLKYIRPGNGFQPAFPMFAKSNVNGDPSTVNPVFNWLKSGCGPITQTILETSLISWTPVMTNDITWNFEKFLVSKTGQLYKRYSPQTLPELLAEDIYNLIDADY